MTETSGVTKIVDRVPRPGMEASLEQAIKALIAAATRFPGHLGVSVTRPALPNQPGFRMVYRFDNCEHLRAWEESAERAPLLEAADRYTQGAPRLTVLSGMEAWFTLPSTAAQLPRRARMSLVSWFGIFPLVFLYDQLLRWALPGDTPLLLKIAANTALVVPTMTYLAGPLLTRLFRTWLYPQSR
jgi:antibiotic biosynthesis monooxygenase (ABM) superfamily enzyme